MPDLSPAFISFLKTSTKAAKSFAEIIKEYSEHSGSLPAAQAPAEEDRPRAWTEGQKHEMTTVGISEEDLNAVAEESADAAVVEKFITYVRGFVSGVML